jgi:hypothetical protein
MEANPIRASVQESVSCEFVEQPDKLYLSSVSLPPSPIPADHYVNELEGAGPERLTNRPCPASAIGKRVALRRAHFNLFDALTYNSPPN